MKNILTEIKNRQTVVLGTFFILLIACKSNNDPIDESVSYCNPLNLNYRFQVTEASYREGADPTVVWFKDRYYLFASMSGGYWHSKDLGKWSFIETDEIPTEDYAPTAIAIQDTMYFMASSEDFDFMTATGKPNAIYKAADPLSGKWQIATDSIDFGVWDPAFFMDDNQRLYFYWGCHPGIPIKGIEMDYKKNFSSIGDQVDLLRANLKEKGWEVYGEVNEDVNAYSWLEGAWVNKHEGKYYLQYSSPGTQFNSYNDAVYVAENPLGPYKLQNHNPFSYKPSGFIGGAGHGSTFTDEYGNYWHASTMAISVKHNFERRIGIWPAFFDKDGVFYTYTAYGDFPHEIPDFKMNGPEDFQPKWMLLSYNKPVEVSSSLSEYPKENAVNENVRTYWSADSGNADEWLMIDLEENSTVHALQVNFAEQNSTLLGRSDSIYQQYKIECSTDKQDWKLLVDKTRSKEDAPHDFIEFSAETKTRYIRITNYRVPDGNFAISGFRVFGFGKGNKPKPVDSFSVERNMDDKRQVMLKWPKQHDAVGYNIRYGVAPDKLYSNYQVFDIDSLTILSLNSTMEYYFAIDAFNESGITAGTVVLSTLK
ncbi:family 43 glycosylhydrolase [uncultured Draconibacterium sp.]|uniref:family 43 glycosylhydrolase n=1 Tax=uncultured Draconibacterium sp. TaxID=1573823 RepID=UPI0025DDE932|nr:family 43 glycosylhydrolase [uncultured Draconibacterium sp.]